MSKWGKFFALVPAMAALVFVLGATPVNADATEELWGKISAEYSDAAANNRVPDFDLLKGLLDKIIAEDPSDERALAMIKDVQESIFLKLMENEKLRPIVLELFGRAKRGLMARQNDPEKIKSAVRKLSSNDTMERFNAIDYITLTFGEFAVPYIIEGLGDENDDERRTGAVLCLQHMGPEAVLPLTQGLYSSNTLLRRNVSDLFGVIRDDRAVPYLLKTIDTDNDELVRNSAARSLFKITGSETFVESTPAAFAKLGWRYLNDPLEFQKFRKLSAIWNWDAETAMKLSGTIVTNFSYNERIAEQLALEALNMEPGYTDAAALLALSLMQQKLEASEVLESLKASGTGIGDFQLLVDALYKAEAKADTLGAPALSAALAKSLENGMPVLAASCIKGLQHVVSPAKLATAEGAPILDALSFDDKRVRYAAAECILHLNPKMPFDGDELVIDRAKQALGEIAIRSVLVISQDVELRNMLNETLRDLGHFPVNAMSLTAAKKAAYTFPSKDAFILDSRIPNALSLVQAFKKETTTAGIPVLVYHEFSPEYEAEKIAELEGNYGTLAAGYFFGVNAPALSPVLDKIFKSDTNIQREKARKMVESMSGVIAGLSPTDTMFDLSALESVLCSNISEVKRGTAIQAYTCRALAKIGTAMAVDPLAGLVANADADVEARVAAAYALGAVLRSSVDVVGDSIFEIMLTVFDESGPEIEKAVGKALGAAPLSPEQRLQIQNHVTIKNRDK